MTEVEETKVDAPVERMGEQLLSAIVDELRVAGASWQQLSKSQQDNVIDRLRTRVKYLSTQAIELISKGSRESARVRIESVTVKDGAKAVLQVGDSVHAVIDYVGSSAILVLCDPEQYFGGMDAIEGEDDQRALGLDDAEDEAA